MNAAGEIARAQVEREGGRRWTRILPVLALLLAAGLLREAWSTRGPRVVVRAADGHGLRPGDALRYRGIEVGKVESLELDDGTREVLVGVRLARSAGDLARRGARFWIARPILGIEGVRGLETALGARYLAVLPGNPDAPAQAEFVALEEPPLFESEDPDALEVVLQSSQRAGLVRGAPITYRGIPIGSLVSVALASDATAVEARARILAPYAELVRADSRFHRTRGADLSLGCAGSSSVERSWAPGRRRAPARRPAPPARPPASASSSRRNPRSGEGAPPRRGRTSPRPSASGQLPGRRDVARAPALRGGWPVPRNGELVGPADSGVPEGAEGGRAIPARRRGWLEGAPARRVPGPPARPARGGRARSPRPGAPPCADPALTPMAVALPPAPSEGLSRSRPLRRALHAVAVARADGAWVGILLVTEARPDVPVPSSALKLRPDASAR